MNQHARWVSLVWGAALAAGFTYGCSGAANGGSDPLPENTGALVARLTDVPSDVQCVEIDTSDARTPMARVDVSPGGSAEVRLAPLNPGALWLWGTAYSVPCYEVDWYGSGSSSGGSSGGGSGSSSGGAVPVVLADGGAGGAATWSADTTYVDVVPGETAQAELHFHQLGAVDVSVSFDDCSSGSFYYPCTGDAEPPSVDAGPAPDSGPVFAVDAGSAVPDRRR